MSDSKSLDEIKALVSQFEQFLSDDNLNLISSVINEMENADGESKIKKEKVKQLIDQLDIDLSEL